MNPIKLLHSSSRSNFASRTSQQYHRFVFKVRCDLHHEGERQVDVVEVNLHQDMHCTILPHVYQALADGVDLGVERFGVGGYYGER
jgi:hypothetical protein